MSAKQGFRQFLNRFSGKVPDQQSAISAPGLEALSTFLRAARIERDHSLTLTAIALTKGKSSREYRQAVALWTKTHLAMHQALGDLDSQTGV